MRYGLSEVWSLVLQLYKTGYAWHAHVAASITKLAPVFYAYVTPALIIMTGLMVGAIRKHAKDNVEMNVKILIYQQQSCVEG